MKVCCISDQHGQLFDIPECDVIVNAGDVCPNWRRGLNEVMQPLWLDETYSGWVKKLPAPMVATFGNHDFLEADLARVPKMPNVTFLVGEAVEVKGLKVFGIPWSLPFYNWAFMKDEAGIAEELEGAPEELDVLISHGPPYGVLDKAADGYHCGSRSLLEAVERLKPRLVVCGHIHEQGGLQAKIGETLVVNAASVDLAYKLREQPWVMTEL